jgi:2-phosphosulfolactate phosphatase
MIVEVALLPAALRPHHLEDRAVAVFDVLRATTTMTTALAAGVREIHVFPDVASARAAGDACGDPANRLLGGEVKCLRPDGFDIGNSPRDIDPARHAGKTLFMSTTNGTRALLAAGAAPVRLAAAVVNAGAVAEVLRLAGRDVTLLCAGTGGEVAMEDLLGCGAVLNALRGSAASIHLAGDEARIAERLFVAVRHDLRSALADTTGGRNVVAADLADDIDHCSRLDAFSAVGIVEGTDPVIRPWRRAGL